MTATIEAPVKSPASTEVRNYQAQLALRASGVNLKGLAAKVMTVAGSGDKAAYDLIDGQPLEALRYSREDTPPSDSGEPLPERLPLIGVDEVAKKIYRPGVREM